MSDEVVEGAIIRTEEIPRDLSTDLRRWIFTREELRR